MITFLGYISLYLIIGVVLLPVVIVNSRDDENKTKMFLYIAVFTWPLMQVFAIFYMLTAGWEDFKNYK